MEAIIDAFAPTVLFLLFIVLIITIARTRGISWDKGEPKGKIIIAKVKRYKSEKAVYEVLFFSQENNIYYNDVGDEVLYCCIEKFAVLED